MSGYADRFTMMDLARGIALKSTEEVKSWMGEWLAASSDGTVEVVEVIDARDVVVSVLGCMEPTTGRWAPRRQRPALLDARGPDPPFDEEGRIVIHDNFFDQLSIFVQLGFAEPPPQPESDRRDEVAALLGRPRRSSRDW